MNYYAARQRIGENRWDWTVEHDKVITRSGPCVLHGDGHATKEEAERHFYDWDLQTMAVYVENDPKIMHQCDAPGCKTPTDKGLATRHRWKVQWFCDLHRIKEIFVTLNPFKPGIMITQS